MTNLLTLSLALSAAQPVAEPPADHEIEVIANKLRTWRGDWKLTEGKVTCKTKRSTGDTAIDAIGCDAMVECIAPIAPQFVALGEAKLSRDEMNQRANALVEEAGVGDCVVSKREAGIAALAAARRSTRS